MKNKMNFIRRLKVCWIFFKTLDSSFLGEYCPYCKSHRIRSIKPQNTFYKGDNTHVYTTIYECKKCGARANTEEVWTITG